MAGKDLTWQDTEKIGIALCRKYPETEPGSLPLRDVHAYATALAGFTGDPGNFDERTLEAIRGAWTAEFLDRTQ